MVTGVQDSRLRHWVDQPGNPSFRVAERLRGEVLNPRQTWQDKDAYDVQAKNLVKSFEENFKQYAANTTDEIKLAGPKSA